MKISASQIGEIITEANNLLARLKAMTDNSALAGADRKRAVSVHQAAEAVFSQIDQMTNMEGWLNDIYLDRDGSLFAVMSWNGKLWRAAITMNGDTVQVGNWTEVVIDFPEATRAQISVIREGDTARFLVIAATSVINRVSEIDSRDLFDSFIRHAQSTDQYPYLTVAHAGEALRIGQADWLFRDGDIYIASGMFDFSGDNSLLARAAADAISADTDNTWGISIGFEVEEWHEEEILDGIKIPVYRKGRNVEISLLIEAHAASHYTTTNVVRGKDKMSKVLEEALRKLLKDDKVAEAFNAKVDETQRQITERHLITRDQETSVTANEETDKDKEVTGEEVAVAEAIADAVNEAPVSEKAAAELVVDESLVEAISNKMVNELTGVFTQLSNQIAQLQQAIAGNQAQLETVAVAQAKTEERLKVLEHNEDQKREAWTASLPRPTQKVVYRPSEQTAETATRFTLADIASRNLSQSPLTIRK